MALIALQNRLNYVTQARDLVLRCCANYRSAMAAGPVSAHAVIELAQQLRRAYADAVQFEADTDLREYTKVQLADPTFDVLAVIAGLKVLVEAAIAACQAAIPVDGDGYLLMTKWNADTSTSVRALSIAQTADIRAALATIEAAVPV